MPNIASWNPPAELLQLGDPDRAYWSRRLSPLFIWITAALTLLAVGLEVGLVYVAALTSIIPSSHQYLIYVLSAVFLGGAGMVLANAAWWGSRRLNYFYGFFPSGLVLLTGRRWAFLPWRDIRSFDKKYEDPLFVLEDKTHMVIVHDFPDPEDFYTDLARYVEAKNRLVDEIPITASLVKYDKSTRRQLIFGALLFGASVAVSLTHLDLLDIVIFADRRMSPDELVKVTSPQQLPRAEWMTVDSAKALPTSGQITTRRNGVTYVDSKIVLVPVKDHFIVANVRNNWESGRSIRGEMSIWKNDEPGGQRQAVLDQVAAEFPQYRDKFLPIQLDATVPTEIHAQAFALCLAIGLVVGAGLLFRGVWSARHSYPHLELNLHRKN